MDDPLDNLYHFQSKLAAAKAGDKDAEEFVRHILRRSADNAPLEDILKISDYVVKIAYKLDGQN